MLLFLTACGNNKLPWKTAKIQDPTLPGKSEITAAIDESKLSESSAEIQIKNNGSAPIYFGWDYEIQVFVNKSWYKINVDDPDWPAGMEGVEANTEETYQIEWTRIYGKLPAGKYRFANPYSTKPYSADLTEDDVFYIVCEFNVK